MASDPIRTESRISKLGVINFSVFRFHLVHYNVKIPTWWWSESSRSLIGAEGICIGFGDMVMPLGCNSVNSFVSCTTLRFAPGFAYQSSCRIKLRQEISISNNRLSSLSPAISPLKIEIIDSVLISVILVRIHVSTW